MLKRFLSYYRPHRKLFAVDIGSAILRAGSMVAIPYLVVKMLGRQELAGSTIQEVWLRIGLLTVLIAFMAVTDFVNLKWGHYLGTKIEANMRQDLFSHLQKLSYRYFDNTKTGHIMSRLSNDLNTISELAHHGPEDFLLSISLMLGSLVFMFIMNWRMAIIVAIPLPILVIWGGSFRLKMRSVFRDVRERVADINSNVENAVQGIREVQSHAMEEASIGRFDEVNGSFRDAKFRMYDVMALFHSGMTFMMEFYAVIIVGGGMILVHYRLLSLVELIGFLMYRRFMFQPVRRLIGFMEQFQQGRTAFDRFTEIMDVEPEIQDAPDAVELNEVTGDIRFEDLSFKYDDDAAEWVVENINLHVPAGKTVALVGQSGAGKSTLASLIPRFYEPQHGVVTIDGTNINRFTRKSLRSRIGIVQQNVFLFDSTIRDNITFANPEATEQELIQAAKDANILDFILSLENGFDTLVGEHGVKLSGGQKQRISIARVFLKRPSILIFDEATSSLDTESEELIQDAMDRLCENRTALIIAHRLSTVRNANYTYVLRDGHIVEQGTHQDLLGKNGYYADLYQRHQL
jgi:ATP-binding cassette subfamily B protein